MGDGVVIRRPVYAQVMIITQVKYILRVITGVLGDLLYKNIVEFANNFNVIFFFLNRIKKKWDTVILVSDY